MTSLVSSWFGGIVAIASANILMTTPESLKANMAMAVIATTSKAVMVIPAANQYESSFGVTHAGSIACMIFIGSSPAPDDPEFWINGKMGMSVRAGDLTTELNPKPSRTPEMVANSSVTRAGSMVSTFKT